MKGSRRSYSFQMTSGSARAARAFFYRPSSAPRRSLEEADSIAHFFVGLPTDPATQPCVSHSEVSPVSLSVQASTTAQFRPQFPWWQSFVSHSLHTTG